MGNIVNDVLIEYYDVIAPSDIRLLRRIGVIEVDNENITKNGSENLCNISWEYPEYKSGLYNELRDLCNLGIVYVYEDSLDVLIIRAPAKLIPTYKRIVELGMVERLCEEQSYSEDE